MRLFGYLLAEVKPLDDAMSNSKRKRKRRWFQVSLRSLLLLFLLSGVLSGLLGLRLHYARQQRRAVSAITKLQGTISFSDAWPMLDGAQIPKWLVKLLGSDFFLNADGVDLRNQTATDASIAPLKELVYLRTLQLSHTTVTDSGLAALSQLRRLEVLELDGTSVTDVGLGHFSQLAELRELDLRSTRVTAEGLLCLRHLPNIEKLYIIDTAVTASGVVQLREAFPNTKVYDRMWRTSAETYP